MCFKLEEEWYKEVMLDLLLQPEASVQGISTAIPSISIVILWAFPMMIIRTDQIPWQYIPQRQADLSLFLFFSSHILVPK